MPNNQTPNYALSQWERTDKVLMDDFNEDNAKIDAALGALAAASAKHGNCSIGTFTYTGDGKYGPDNPTRITFPRMPKAFMILGGEGILFGKGGHSPAYGCLSANSRTQAQSVALTWSGTTCSWYDQYYVSVQMNQNGLHLVVAFYAED